MKLTKRMLATQSGAQLLAHITNAMITVRNCLEDGFPEQKISPEDLKHALGEKTLLVVEKICELAIDQEDESERQKQRKEARDAKAGRTPQDAPSGSNAARKRLQRRKKA